MFQSALVVRVVDEMMRRVPFSGSGSTKFSTPCLSAVLPVAMLVQSKGESFGSSEVMSPRTPRWMSPCRFGITPCTSSGSMSFQSAASQPITSTFLAIRSGIVEDRFAECSASNEARSKPTGDTRASDPSDALAKIDTGGPMSRPRRSYQKWSAISSCGDGPTCQRHRGPARPCPRSGPESSRRR